MGKITSTYDYRDESGVVLYRVLRVEYAREGHVGANEKAFWQVRPIPGMQDQWAMGLRGGTFIRGHASTGYPNIWQYADNRFPLPKESVTLDDEVRRVPYRLPELIAANPKQPLFVVEGEKDVATLVDAGFVATCNAMGAGKWQFGFGGFLCGRRVVVMGDNDQPGLQHSLQVAASAIAFGASEIRVFRWPGMWNRDGGDITDWLNEKWPIPLGVESNQATAIQAERRKEVVELVKLHSQAWGPKESAA